jgi:hypothetical protein
MVFGLASWILVEQLFVLFLRLSTASVCKQERQQLKRLLERILIGGWLLVFSGVAVLAIFPRLLVLVVPHVAVLHALLIAFILFSVFYAAAWLYHEGMKRAKR